MRILAHNRILSPFTGTFVYMSYPAINHIEVKPEQIPDGTKVTLRHRAIGMIDPAHREGVNTGWKGMLDLVKGDFSKATGTKV